MNRDSLLDLLRLTAFQAGDERNYREKCGFIGFKLRRHGVGEDQWEMYALENVSTQANSNYETSPTEQVVVFERMQASGVRLWGVYHTHQSTAEPSQNDRAFWRYPPEMKQVIATSKEVKAYIYDPEVEDLIEVPIE